MTYLKLVLISAKNKPDLLLQRSTVDLTGFCLPTLEVKDFSTKLDHYIAIQEFFGWPKESINALTVVECDVSHWGSFHQRYVTLAVVVDDSKLESIDNTKFVWKHLPIAYQSLDGCDCYLDEMFAKQGVSLLHFNKLLDDM